jgi:hypothetical protein
MIFVIAIADPLYGDLYHGAVFVYRYDASSDSWKEFQDPITNENCGRFFGSVVSLTDDEELMVGCYVQENDHPGAVYYYSLQGDQFELRQTIVTSQPSKKPDDDSIGLAPFLERSNNHFGQSKSDVGGRKWREKSRSKEPNQCTQYHKQRQQPTKQSKQTSTHKRTHVGSLNFFLMKA